MSTREGDLDLPNAEKAAKRITTIPHIPQTTSGRLDTAIDDKPLNVNALFHIGVDKLSAQLESRTEHTILYLAYGSNLSSKTFRESRGIVPISQVTVLVPDLCLTFDLAGTPYTEPCFAGTQYRDTVTGLPFSIACHAPPESTTSLLSQLEEGASYENLWRKPLIGVVYEVTLSDYARIIATEGAGSSYIDIVVDSYPFPSNYDPSAPVPHLPDTKPFKAHSLVSPKPGHPRRRPNPNYAQPSIRYKNIIVNGAEEQSLPLEFRNYLFRLHAYTITDTKQRLGQIVFRNTWGRVLDLNGWLVSVFADKYGRSPPWLRWFQGATYAGIWSSYDLILKKIYGDGERTIGDPLIVPEQFEII